MEPTPDPDPRPPTGGIPWFVVLLFLLSGFAGLTYQVLWQRELGLLFGNTTEATSTTLAVFFLGLALGSWWLGKRSASMRDPLCAFGVLELGIAVTALLLPLALPLYRAVFPSLYGALGDAPAAFTAVKFLLAALLLAPPTILMGGTLPVLTEAAVRRGGGLARAGILLYAVNTAGALLGAALAGFVLPRVVGYRASYGIALATSVLVGALAVLQARRAPDTSTPQPLPADDQPEVSSRALLTLAALSGFVSLALQVLWTRMTALAVVNSVYAFAAVLVLVLAALAVGAVVARWLARVVERPRLTLQVLLIASALATLFSGAVFRLVTGSPPGVGRGEDFGAYMLGVFGVLSVSILPAAFAAGIVFPFLLRIEETRGSGDAGRRVGRLVAANTCGALLGALVAGFLLPPTLGLWASIALLAGLYAAGLLLAPRGEDTGRVIALAGGGLVVLLAVGHGLTDGARGDRWDLRRQEEVIERYEGSAGAVRVVRRRGALKLRFNNSYTLGGTSQPRWERYQAHIPLALHGDPKRVFFLGLGTGITVGASLRHDVERVRVAEIVPEAVTASREHFGPWLGGLFHDERARVVVEDGRTMLLGLEDEYDVIVGDLFLPWRPGAALLYSVEHVRAVRARLAPGGLFAQWLPLYQLSREEFDGIVASFLEVFGSCTVWRGDFFGRRPIVALVGHADDTPWNVEATLNTWRKLEESEAIAFGPALDTLPFMLYAGRITQPVEGARRITDDKPWLGFEAPIAQRARAAGLASTFGGPALTSYLRSLLDALPPKDDPWLAGLDEAQRGYVWGGLHLQETSANRSRARRNARNKARAAYEEKVPPLLRPDRRRWTD